MNQAVAEVEPEVAPAAEDDGPPPLGAGEVVAPGYVVIGHLHRSRHTDVYDAWSEERDCRCAAKVVRPDRIQDSHTGRALLHEGRLLKRLAHPHIARAYEVIARPSPTVILETLTGATLEHLIESRGKRHIPVAAVIYLGLHLCSAIHYLHRHGYLHLDLKPSNIVSDRGLAKVLDLNIAKPPGRCRHGGTPVYMAPEQVRCGYVGAAADVWGIGMVLFEATAGRRPFRSDEGKHPQVERRAESVRAYRRLPAEFAQAIDSCLEPDPARRPTIAELSESLRRLVNPQ